MANYTDTALENAQYKLTDSLTLPEFKHKPSAALTAFMMYSDMLIPVSERERITNVKESDQQVVDVSIITKQATGAAAGNRSYTHPGSINDSKKATLSFTTYVAKFKYSTKQADRNINTLSEQIAAQMRSALIDLHGAIETALVAQMNTSKSQVVVSATPYGGTWDAANHIFGVGQVDNKLLFERIRGFMVQQYYKGELMLVHSEAFRQMANYIIQQGGGNSESLFWQLGGIKGFNSLEISTAGYEGSGYAFAPGTVGLVPWIPKLNRSGFGDTFKTGGSYSYMEDPLGSGLPIAIHQYAVGADNHNAAGERQDIDIEVELSVDIAPLIAPMSTANASPIFKVGLLDA